MFEERQIQAIYNHIQEDISKQIYIDRLNYSMTKDYRFLNDMVDCTVRSRQEWKEFCSFLTKRSTESSMTMFGAGIWGNILYQETYMLLHWKYVVDSNPHSKEFHDRPLLGFGEFIEGYDGGYVVISSYKNCLEMEEQLIKYGIPCQRIINAGKVIYGLTEGAIYFDLKELLPCRKHEIFVDTGCFDGATTKQFFVWCGGKGYSYCLEPDAQNITVIQEKLSDEKNYEIIDKAAWSKTTTLSMNEKGNYATSVSEFNACCEHMQKTQAVALDDMLKDKEVTFIKMDIEGAEVEALHGAAQIISEQKPRLAISVYHKRDDIWTIPQTILHYNPEYTFYLRHYSFSDYDTVLYAIPQ